MISKPEQLLEEVKKNEPVGTSDHNTVEFKVPVRTDEENWKDEYFNYRTANFKGIRKYLKNVVWGDIFNNLYCEQMWTVFKGISDEVINECVPKQTRKKKKKHPLWCSRKLRKLRKN